MAPACARVERTLHAAAPDGHGRRLAIDTPDVHFLTPVVAGAIVFWMNTRLFDPGAVREAEAGAEARQGVGRGEGLPPPGNDSALGPECSITQKGTFWL